MAETLTIAAVIVGALAYGIGVTCYVLLQRRSPQATLAWLLALIFVPVIGPLWFWLFGMRRAWRMRRRSRALRAMGRAYAGLTEEDASPNPQVQQIIHANIVTVGVVARPRPGSVTFIHDGDEAYAAIEEAIRQATHHVHAEFYIWEPGVVADRLLALLAQKAREGLQVRVLVDALGSPSARAKYFRPLTDAGGRFAVFNPATLRRVLGRLTNFRSHRKIVVCDGNVSFTGGLNVADYHSRQCKGEAAWRDTFVKIVGPATWGLALVFFENWYYATRAAPENEAHFSLVPRAPAEPMRVPVQVVASGPDERFEAICRLYFNAITHARRRIELAAAYFVPDEVLMTALTTAAARGVEVRILVPAVGDVPIVAYAAQSYYSDLLAAGARVFELHSPVMHSKTLVVDDLIAIVGSANFDNRSFRLNSEICVAVFDATAAADLSAAFQRDIDRSIEVDRSEHERASLGTRLLRAGARLFAPQL